MTVFAATCLAETRGVPLEDMRELWRRHWFWRGALVLTGAGAGARGGEGGDAEEPHRVSENGLSNGWEDKAQLRQGPSGDALPC